MKDLCKRILAGIVVLLIVFILLYLAINFFEEKEYKYLTIENEWGISSKCFLDEDQFAICKLDDDWVIVRQYYEV